MVYAIAKRVPYAAHVIVLFTFAFSAFVLVYVHPTPVPSSQSEAEQQDIMYFLITFYQVYQLPVHPVWWRCRRG